MPRQSSASACSARVNTTYNAFFFVTLAPWDERKKPEEKLLAIYQERQPRNWRQLPEAQAFAFPAAGHSRRRHLGRRVVSSSKIAPARTSRFWLNNTRSSSRPPASVPKLPAVNTTFIPSVPQVFAKVDRDKVLKQGVNLGDVYQTLQTFMGGVMVNYFNRFGRVWQVYVQADGEFRTSAENVGQFYVRNASG